MEVYLTTLLASLVGSLHCAGMCGPLVVAVHRKEHSYINSAVYHFSRLLSYLTICLLGLILSHNLELSQFLKPIQSYIFYFTVSLLLLIGINSLISGNISHFIPKIFQRFFQKIMFVKNKSSLLYSANMGFATGFLPCGWLYSFVIASLLMENYLQSLMVVSSFWIGTVPILYFLEYFSKLPLKFLRDQSPRFVGISLIIITLLIVYKRSNNPIEFCPNHDIPKIHNKMALE